MQFLSITIYTFHRAIISVVLIPVIVLWGDRRGRLLLSGPLRRDMWKL